ncbi:MAG: CehA/McbA family metallohydrolase [Anaerolineae bacterium]|nr:CehA/McbA family metallohydrolase [Anaerolineae bacterium]
MRFRYDTRGRWYKGNTHLHTTASDGGKTHAEVAALYAGAGFSFLFSTDHFVASDLARNQSQSPLLWLDGVELDGRDGEGSLYHVACLGRTEGISRDMGFSNALESARAQGALLVLAHPFWTGNSFNDTQRWRFHGVEIYNHVCQWLNGKGDARPYWSAMLRATPDTLAFAVDDAHLRPEHPGWNGGWIVVNAKDLSADNIMEAIWSGNYYSSCGPEFYRLEFNGTQVSFSTSPVQFIRLVGPGSLGKRLGSFNDETITEATMSVPSQWDYAYIEIEDRQGRRAWTNTLFTDK